MTLVSSCIIRTAAKVRHQIDMSGSILFRFMLVAITELTKINGIMHELINGIAMIVLRN